MKKQNPDLNAAHDYRRQLQEKLSKISQDELRQEFESNLESAITHCRKMFPEAEMDDFERKLASIINASHELGTPLDDPLSSDLMQSYMRTVENAIKKLEHDLRAGVSAGILHGEGLDAMQQPVMMTDASVVLVNNNLGMLTNRLSKLLARSLSVTILPDEKFQISDRLEDTMEVLHNDTELQRDWDYFFMDYSLDPEARLHGEVMEVIGRQRQTLWSDLNEAMFTFVLAHEYGHHLAKHSLDGKASVDGDSTSDKYFNELQADCYAAHICIESISDSEGENIFLNSAAGGAALLTALELINIGRCLLENGEYLENAVQRSHPPLEYRLKALEKIAKEYHKENYPPRLQTLLNYIIEYVWLHSSKFILRQHEAGIRPLRKETGGWLPC
ncbi:hypothetical protein SAMN04244579_02946 [Azotobacter beijerinckii]|uniref:Uncharacterized protein n=1 Tax=Azotobacter beijerinckii TaxID=170623 RepID=A0A1H6VL22_9GAMM|nr:hypothetical protein [Azotobacter beijerinckii]SEJ05321.1 hypothetical protein SAMN04244579_02946 [Azotobacter beijerinckii]